MYYSRGKSLNEILKDSNIVHIQDKFINVIQSKKGIKNVI